MMTKLDESHYVDLASLISVQFDESGSAKVQLSTGGSLILPPQAAESLRTQLKNGSVAQENAHADAEGYEEYFTLVSRKKAWFVLTENGLRYIVAAVNAKGSCSIRTFDGQTGAFRGKQYRSGDFQGSFPQLRNAKELSVPQQPNLERDCRERLPERLLRHLQDQFDSEKTPLTAGREDRVFNPAFYGYPLSTTFDRSKLDSLLQQFENSVKREIDKKLALELRAQLLSPMSFGLKQETFERLARWCKTDGIYGDGMDIAQRISQLLFNHIIDRVSIGT